MMKRLNTAFLFLALIFIPSLQSCLDDDDKYYLALATFRVAEDEHPYFVLDDGETMYPNNRLFKKIEDGQRVYVHFDILKEEVEGYDYHIEIRGIVEVLTKDVIVMTDETSNNIGDDPINITGAWFGDGYLNVEFVFMGTSSPEERHMVNLVHNNTTGANDENTEEGFINLEFRHNAYEDQPLERLRGIVAFKGPFGDEEDKGLIIRYNSIYDGVKYLKINFTSDSERSSLNRNISTLDTSIAY